MEQSRLSLPKPFEASSSQHRERRRLEMVAGAISNGGVFAAILPDGYGLGFMWRLWIFVVALCHPACKWYPGVKSRIAARSCPVGKSR